MQPSDIITITTDFGHKGPFAAVMKGVILGRLPDAHVIDLAHDIPAQWPPEAGFWVRYAYRYFPVGSVHVAIVDPGVGTERDILLVEYDEHVFIAPDNGLLGWLVDDADGAAVYTLDADSLPRLGIRQPSATFHGRDIFAPGAAEIAAGRVSVNDIATPTDTWTPGWLDEPVVSAVSVSGTIVTLDSFGNLISNIDAKLLDGLDDPIVHIGGHDVPLLQYLALINSFGVVEIAKAEGNAADGLGLERGAPLTIRNRA